MLGGQGPNSSQFQQNMQNMYSTGQSPLGAFQGNPTGDPLGSAMSEGEPNMNPYINAGQQSLGNYQSALSYMNNPNQFIGNMMKGWQMSPQAMQAQKQGIASANAASAAGGMLGSGAEQTALQKQGQAITAADQQQYLQNRMNVWSNYLRGQSSISGMGLQAGESLDSYIGRLRQAQAEQEAAKEAEDAQKSSASGAGIGSLIGGVGGFMIGGPAGAMAGSAIGGSIGGGMS
jgi:hypothetical protein